ncbi:MAG: hypothetical protein V8S95_02200 [Odoribacter sp.]
MKRYTGSAACCEQLIYYLVHGYMGWDCREWSFDLKQYLLRILAEEAEKFRRFLKKGGRKGYVNDWYIVWTTGYLRRW